VQLLLEVEDFKIRAYFLWIEQGRPVGSPLGLSAGGIMGRYCLYSLLAVWLSVGGVISHIEAANPEPALSVALIAHSGYPPKDYEQITKFFSEISGIPVNVNYILYEKQLDEIYKSASLATPAYDVVAVDALWVPDLVSKGALLPVDDFIKGFKNDIVPTALKAFALDEKIWAVPHLSNFQLLFYNKALLAEAGFEKPPATLEEMVSQMKVLKIRGAVEYPWHDAWGVGMGLIDEYTWLVGAFGDTLFSPSGEPIFNKGAGLEALRFMIQLLDDRLINPSSLTSGVLETKDEFITGNCVFNTNWVFQAALAKDASLSKVSTAAEVGLLPVARKVLQKKQYEFNSASVGAFQGLAIVANTSNPKRAWSYIRFLTSPLVQKAFLQEMPVWNSLQTDATLKKIDTLLEIKRNEMLSVLPLPNIRNYGTISSMIEKSLMAALKKEVEPEVALNQAVEEIKAKGISMVIIPSSSSK